MFKYLQTDLKKVSFLIYNLHNSLILTSPNIDTMILNIALLALQA